jgi:hypothetical protein
MSIANAPEFRNDRTFGRARSEKIQAQQTRPSPNRVEAALDVLRTLLALALIGAGVVLLRFLLILARGTIGH